jgi:hypothetical protein
VEAKMTKGKRIVSRMPSKAKKPGPTGKEAITALVAAGVELHHLQDLIAQVGIAIALCGGDDKHIELLAHWADAIGRNLGVAVNYLTLHPLKIATRRLRPSSGGGGRPTTPSVLACT